MRKPKQMKFLIIVSALLLVSFLWLLQKTPWTEIVGQLKTAKLSFLGLSVVTMGAFFACEALSLHQLFNHFRYKISLKRTYGYALVDFYYSGITPGASGGQPSQLFYMNRDGIEPGIASVGLLCFNLCYHISALFIGGFGMIHSRGLLEGHTVIKLLLIYGLAAQAVLILLFTALLISPKLVSKLLHGLIHGLHRLKIIRKLDKWDDKVEVQLNNYQQAANLLKQSPMLVLKVLGLTTIHLVLFYSVPYLLLRAFDLPVNYLELLTLQACLQLAVESLPIPGGLGVNEASFLRLYGPIIGGEKVVGILLLSRLISYTLGLVGGGVTSLVMLTRPRRRTRTIIETV